MLLDFKKSMSISTASEVITAAEFEKKTNQLSNYLLSTGFQKNDYALIHADNSIEYLFLILALWKISAVPVLVNNKLTENELKEIIQVVNPKFIFTDNAISNFPECIRINNLQFDGDEQIKNDCTSFESELIIFTSGSSGNSKGVVHTLGNIYNSVMNIKEIERFDYSDNFLLSLPLYHIGGLMIFFRSYFSSAKFTIPKSLKTDELISEINLNKITILSLVPTQLRRIINQEIISPKSLRSIYIGGAASDDELIEKALALSWQIKKVYGSTETCSMVAINDLTKNPNRIKSSGKPITNNYFYILKDDGNPCSFNESGQIGIKGNTLFKKYFLDEEETSKVFLGEIFLTGDYGYIDAAGFLFITGRIKKIIISGGENIDPIEVENAIKKIDESLNPIVFGIKNADWGEIVCAVIESQKKYSEIDIKNQLRNKIAPHKIPKKIKVIQSFPRNDVGKVEINKLEELFNH
ncbi:MAG: o-succinylbenzoate--CoA ligase [Ignavibacteriales bacterium]